jgi:DNA-binding CsgD family transcriptional regulator
LSDIDDLGASISKSLTKRELVELTVLTQRVLSVDTEANLKALAPALQRLFDFRFLMCGFGSKNPYSEIDIGPYVNLSYPEEYVVQYMKSGMVLQDPVVTTAFSSPGVYYLADLIEAVSIHSEENLMRSKSYQFTQSFEIKEGYSSSVNNVHAGTTSVFSFMAPRLSRDERTEIILAIISPHLHEALRRIFAVARRVHDNPLTLREQEILQWVKEGKSSWQVSMILSISEATVKFHIKNILRKLDATTRAQAVASAMQRGYIEFGGVSN